MSIIGDPQLARALNHAIKEVYQTNRAFLTIVIEADGRATIHSNMDRAEERIELTRRAFQTLEGRGSDDSGIVVVRQ